MKHISHYVQLAISDLLEQWESSFDSDSPDTASGGSRPISHLYGFGRPSAGLIHVIGGFSHHAVRSVTITTFLALQGNEPKRQALIVTSASPEAILQSLLTAMCGMGTSDIEIARATEAELQQAIDALKWLGRQSINLLDPHSSSPEELLRLLKLEDLERGIVWIEGLSESPWRRGAEDNPDADGPFYRGLHEATRTRNLSSLISVGGRTSRFNGRDMTPRLEHLPGSGHLEEIAHFVEWVVLHEPDELGMATSEYVDVIVAKNKLGACGSISRFGWNSAIDHVITGSQQAAY